MLSSQYAIETHGLTKLYGPIRAVVDLNLVVPSGTIFGFLGPNGAGKTTTIRMLLDLIRPTAGRAEILGLDCQRRSLAVKRHIGYLPGELHLYDNLTGMQHVTLVGRLHAAPPEPRHVQQLAATFELDLARHVGAYSRGNKQKLGLLLALMNDPEVLILDEPTSGLDPIMQERVQRLLQERTDAGRTVFFSSHNLTEVQRLCHVVGLMREGHLVAVESIAALQNRFFHIVDVTFAGPVLISDFNLPGIRLRRFNRTEATFEVRGNLDGLIKAIARHTIVDLRTKEPGLEDLFFSYFERPREVGEGAKT
jgi:ABC-2 type transport system ATP-binding protein